MSKTNTAKELLGKLDPSQILDLAKTIVKATGDVAQMKIKAENFVRALAEHEHTTQIALEQQTKQLEVVVAALKESISLIDDPKLKLEAIKELARFGNTSVTQLGESARTLIGSVPTRPDMIE